MFCDILAGEFGDRERPLARPLDRRSFTVGIGGPVGSGKTALVRQLCIHFRDDYNIACVTNDIFTREDAEFLLRNTVSETPGMPDVDPSERSASLSLTVAFRARGGRCCAGAS